MRGRSAIQKHGSASHVPQLQSPLSRSFPLYQLSSPVYRLSFAFSRPCSLGTQMCTGQRVTSRNPKVLFRLWGLDFRVAPRLCTRGRTCPLSRRTGRAFRSTSHVHFCVYRTSHVQFCVYLSIVCVSMRIYFCVYLCVYLWV